MLLIKNCNLIIFDFDGVIANTNYLKTEAFEKAIINEPIKLRKKFIDYHKKNFGISRYVKFKYYYTNINKQKKFDKDLGLTLDKYSKINLESSCKSKLIYGVNKFIKDIYKIGIPMYVISSSDEKDLKKIINHKKLNKYFKGIYGSPNTKYKNYKIILNKIKSNKNIIAFGDSKSDYEVAKKNHINFIYVSGKSFWKNQKEIKDKIQYQIVNFSKKNLDKVIL